MDDDSNDRSHNFIDSINSSGCMHIVNNSKFDKKIYNIINDRNEFINYIFTDLNNNSNIAIVSQSRRQYEEYKKLICEDYTARETDDCYFP